MSKTKLQIVALTDRGMEREHNEDYHGYIGDLNEGKSEFLNSKTVDSLSERGSLLIVADGMGGTNAGEVASKIAVESTRDFILSKASALKSVTQSEAKNILFDAVKKAQNEIVQHQKNVPNTNGMGTTLVLTWIVKNQAYIVWVGDSRCYGFNPKDGLYQLSKDHSYVQELVDAGKITEEQAFYHPQNNIITQSLGDQKRPPSPGFNTYNLQVDDTILICSDGLNGMVNDSKIEMLLKSTTNIELCAKILIDEANAAGGHDNITILMAYAENVDSPLPPVKHKKTNNSNANQKNNHPKKDRKMWIGIVIGIVITALIMSGVKYATVFFSNKNIPSDTIIKPKTHLIDTTKNVLNKNDSNKTIKSEFKKSTKALIDKDSKEITAKKNISDKSTKKAESKKANKNIEFKKDSIKKDEPTLIPN